MTKGKMYTLTLTDGDIVEGVYMGDRQGFYILRANNREIPVRSSSVRGKKCNT